MRFRKLRIAWSVAWGLLAVLLIVFWVRSYWWGNRFDVQIAEERPLSISSSSGTLGLRTNWDIASAYRHTPGQWSFTNYPITEDVRDWSWFSFQCELLWANWVGINIFLPHWLVVIASGMLATLPWLRYHFSLRTLLIATTLLAVVLGLAVWLSR
jgi:hypothetical protein